MTTPRLSRRYWRKAIETFLHRHDPIRARWLQEHPRRHEILNTVTTDALDLWLEATRERATSTSPSVWTSTPTEDLESTVLAVILEAPELWENLDEDHPRTPKPPSTPLMLRTIPDSGPPAAT